MSDPKSVQKAALAITRAVGSPASIVIHTLAFAGSFLAVYFGYLNFEQMLLVLTTIVSLEAIYLAIFIQMTINYQAESIEEVSEDLEEIQEDIGEIQEDIDEVQKDVDELQEDVEDIGEEVEEMSDDEQEEAAEENRKQEQRQVLTQIQTDLQRLMAEIERIKNSGKD